MSNDDKMYYLSCPDCKKKVVEETVGYRCENCNKIQMQPNPTYILSARISDTSGSVFVSFLREAGEFIMNGISAKDFREMKESTSNTDEIKDFLN